MTRKFFYWVWLFIIIFATWTSSIAFAATIYVCDGPAPCEPTIQSAVNAAAVTGDTILVAPESYPPFRVIGKDITIRSDEGPYRTWISASGDYGISFANSNSILDGFTVFRPIPEDRDYDTRPRGSGVSITNSSNVSFHNCHIEENYSHNASGVYIEDSSPTFTNSFIEDNFTEIQNPNYILYEIWGSAGNNLFAVGEGGVIMQYDGSSWTKMVSPVSEEVTLNSVWGLSGSSVFAGGIDEDNTRSISLKYNGTDWSTVASFAGPDGAVNLSSIEDIWGSGSNLYVVGWKKDDESSWGFLRKSADSGLTWSVGSAVEKLYGVYGGGSTVIAVGAEGKIYGSTDSGNNFDEMVSPTNKDLNSVWITSDGSYGYAVGMTGIFLTYDGTSWTVGPTDDNDNLYDVWGLSSTTAYAVGDKGVYFYNGSTLDRIYENDYLDFRGVWGLNSNEKYAVGSNLFILPLCASPPCAPQYLEIVKAYGGGGLSINGSPTFINTRIKNNSLKSTLGIYTEVFGGGFAFITDSLISSANGLSSQPVFEDSLVASNLIETVDYIGPANGGGLYLENSSGAMIDGCEINLNKIETQQDYSGLNGGGVMLSISNATILNSVITDNELHGIHEGSHGYGGGLLAKNDSEFSMNNCSLANNTVLVEGGYSAGKGGGISCFASPKPTIYNTVLAYNTVTATSIADGGGIYCNASSPTIMNVLVHNNSAEFGGGITGVSVANFTMMNVSIAKNTASFNGGGVYLSWMCSPTVTNSIIWSNTSEEEIFISETSTLSTNFSDYPSTGIGGIGTVLSGNGNISANPLFADLENGDFHLSFGSPAVDTATSTGAPDHDLDGIPRPRPIGGLFDMGAFELCGALPIVDEVSPSFPCAGDTVSIYGNYFENLSSVVIFPTGLTAANCVVVNDSTINNCTVPAGVPASGNLTVTNFCGMDTDTEFNLGACRSITGTIAPAVSGITIQLDPDALITTTDALGQYTFNNLEALTYYTVYCYGVESAGTDYAAETKAPVDLTAGDQQIDFALATAGQISGTVVNTLGQSLTGIPVGIHVYTGRDLGLTSGNADYLYVIVPQATTANGVYTINHVPETDFGVVFIGNEPAVGATLYGIDNDSYISVTGGNTTANVNFTLQNAAAVSGTLLNVSSVAISDVTVSAAGFQDGSRFHQFWGIDTVSNNSGIFYLDYLKPATTWRFNFNDTVRGGMSFSNAETLISDLVTEIGTFTMPLTTEVSGSITNYDKVNEEGFAHQTLLSEYHIQVLSFDSATTYTDNDYLPKQREILKETGVAEVSDGIDGEQVGEYNIWVPTPAGSSATVDLILEWKFHHADGESGSSMFMGSVTNRTVTQGTQLNNVDITSGTDWGFLQGEITTDNGGITDFRSVGLVVLDPADASGKPLASAVPFEDGVYNFYRIPTGTLTIRAVHTDYDHVEDTVTISKGQLATLDLQFKCLSAPTDLTASVSISQITLSWTDTSGCETSYLVERAELGGTFTQIADISANSTSYADSGVTLGTTYNYRVRIYSSGSLTYSGYSNEVQATAGDLGPDPTLAAPSSLAADVQSSTKILLSWDDNSSNETGFRIERSLSVGSGFTEIATVAANETSYTNTGLTKSTTYFYRVRAYNNDPDESSYSNTDSDKTYEKDTSGGFSDDDSGGGGGGCSVVPANYSMSISSAVANSLILLLPLIICGIRRRKGITSSK